MVQTARKGDPDERGEAPALAQATGAMVLGFEAALGHLDVAPQIQELALKLYGACESTINDHNIQVR